MSRPPTPRQLPPFEQPPVGEQGIREALAEGRPAMIVDRPDLFGSRRAPAALEASGWAWSGSGIAQVLVGIDGRVVARAATNLVRLDLRGAHGAGDRLAGAGFAARIRPCAWTPGPHEVAVVATDGAGRSIGVSSTIERVAPPQPETRRPPSDARIAPADTRPGEDLAATTRSSSRPNADFLARHRWAAAVVAGGEVLHLGHEIGAGTAVLAETAARAIAADRSAALVAHARSSCAGVARFEEATPEALPFADGSFDHVVCFDLPARAERPEAALDEIRRVLRPGGKLVTSSPNPDAYPPGDPLLERTLSAELLGRMLAERFPNIALHHQLECTVAAVPDYARTGAAQRVAAFTDHPNALTSSAALRTLAIASDIAFSPPAPVIALGDEIGPNAPSILTAELEERIAATRSAVARVHDDARLQSTLLSGRSTATAAEEQRLAATVADLEAELVDSLARYPGAARISRGLSAAARAALEALPRSVRRRRS